MLSEIVEDSQDQRDTMTATFANPGPQHPCCCTVQNFLAAETMLTANGGCERGTQATLLHLLCGCCQNGVTICGKRMTDADHAAQGKRELYINIGMCVQALCLLPETQTGRTCCCFYIGSSLCDICSSRPKVHDAAACGYWFCCSSSPDLLFNATDCLVGQVQCGLRPVHSPATSAGPFLTVPPSSCQPHYSRRQCSRGWGRERRKGGDEDKAGGGCARDV